VIDLDAIEARANAATAGPWEVTWSIAREESLTSPLVLASPTAEVIDFGGCQECAGYSYAREDDMRFITAAREDVPALVAEVRRLRGYVDATLW